MPRYHAGLRVPVATSLRQNPFGQVAFYLVLRKATLGDQALLAALDFLQHIEVVLDVLVGGIVGEMLDHLNGLGFGCAHAENRSREAGKVERGGRCLFTRRSQRTRRSRVGTGRRAVRSLVAGVGDPGLAYFF